MMRRAGVCSAGILGLCLILPPITIFGDFLLRKLADDDAPVAFRAAFDSCVHVLLGCLAWSVTFVRRTHLVNVRAELLFAAVFSTFIDIDHFIKARSFKIEDAVHLTSPPPFHDILLPLLLFTFTIFLYCCNSGRTCNIRHRLLQLSVLHTVHLFRDAARRGLRICYGVVVPPQDPFGLFPFFIPLLPIIARCIILLNESLPALEPDEDDDDRKLREVITEKVRHWDDSSDEEYRSLFY